MLPYLFLFHHLLLLFVDGHSLHGRSWSFLGPFTVGKNELDGNPAFDIIQHYNYYKKTGIRKTNLLSELVTGGSVTWTELKTQRNKKILINLQGVDLNGIVQSLFSMEAQEVQGWIVGEMKIPMTGQYSVSCLNMLTCYVDDLQRMLTGDMFQTGRVLTNVQLTKGKHLVYGYLKFVGRTQVEVKLTRVTKSKSSKKLIFYSPTIVPDLIGLGQVGHDPDTSSSSYFMGTGWISVPVTNRDQYGYRVKFRFKESESIKKYGLQIVQQPESLHYRVYSGQYTTVPIQLTMKHGIESSTKVRECPLNIKLVPVIQKISLNKNEDTNKNKWVEKTDTVSFQLRCRSTRQSFIFTFVDHDGSISKAGAISPLLKRKNENIDGVGVLLSMHGTGVDVSMQTDSYKYKLTKYANDDQKPYTFGIENMWTLAPTRNGAHNWEYTGYLSALKALEILGTPRYHNNGDPFGSIILPSQIASRLPIAYVNDQNVIFAGHSMGGHGAWNIATHVPNRAMGVISAAGWIRKEYYGHSNRFFVHDIGHSYIDSSLKSILENTFIEYNSDLHASNLKGMIVHARIGANDRSVPPFQVRKMVRLLKEYNINTTYEEIPNKDHWWWDTKIPNDGGVLNDQKLRKLYRKMINNKNGISCPTDSFTLVTMHPGSIESKCGMRILQTWIPLSLSKLVVKRSHFDSSSDSNSDYSGETWHIKTQNVRRLSFSGKHLCKLFPCKLILNKRATLRIQTNDIVHYCQTEVIDEAGVEVNVKGAVYNQQQRRRQRRRQWQLCQTSDSKELSLVSNSSYSFEEFERGPTNSGPSRQLFASQFVIVTTSHSLPSYLSLYIANTHMVAASTSVEIVLDTSITDEDKYHKNAFIIGRNNKLLHQQQEEMALNNSNGIYPPVKILKNGFQVGPCLYNESGLGLLFTAPYWDKKNHRSRLRVYMVGNDDNGLRAIASLLQPTIPPMLRAPLSNQVPDFIVVSTKILKEGAGGILSAGMWGYDWRWKEESSYWQC
jgi:hypothetical protein